MLLVPKAVPLFLCRVGKKAAAEGYLLQEAQLLTYYWCDIYVNTINKSNERGGLLLRPTRIEDEKQGPKMGYVS